MIKCARSGVQDTNHRISDRAKCLIITLLSASVVSMERQASVCCSTRPRQPITGWGPEGPDAQRCSSGAQTNVLRMPSMNRLLSNSVMRSNGFLSAPLGDIYIHGGSETEGRGSFTNSNPLLYFHLPNGHKEIDPVVFCEGEIKCVFRRMKQFDIIKCELDWNDMQSVVFIYLGIWVYETENVSMQSLNTLMSSGVVFSRPLLIQQSGGVSLFSPSLSGLCLLSRKAWLDWTSWRDWKLWLWNWEKAIIITMPHLSTTV